MTELFFLFLRRFREMMRRLKANNIKFPSNSYIYEFSKLMHKLIGLEKKISLQHIRKSGMYFIFYYTNFLFKPNKVHIVRHCIFKMKIQLIKSLMLYIP